MTRVITPLLFIALLLASAACAPATPADIDAAVSALVEHGGELSSRELDEQTGAVIVSLYGDYESPYRLPSGRTVVWTAERVLDHMWYMPFSTGKTTTLIPQYDFDWECALIVYDPFDREIFHREVRVE